VKTLDQIWNENFEFLPPGDLTGYSGSCGHDLGGDDGDNQKPSLNTIADKIFSILNGPDGAPLSDAAKQEAINKLVNNYLAGFDQSKDPYGPRPAPYSSGPSYDGPLRFPGNIQPAPASSTDPNDPNIPWAERGDNSAYNTDPASQFDLGGLMLRGTINPDGSITWQGERISPSKAALLKAAFAAAIAAKDAACKRNKSNPNGDPTTGDPKPKPPTGTTPLVTPPTKPPVMEKPFRPFNPNLRPSAGGGIYTGRPVQSTPTYQ
jgi:hypothetical protein